VLSTLRSRQHLLFSSIYEKILLKPKNFISRCLILVLMQEWLKSAESESADQSGPSPLAELPARRGDYPREKPVPAPRFALRF
jgi:hypothetical protein